MSVSRPHLFLDDIALSVHIRHGGERRGRSRLDGEGREWMKHLYPARQRRR
jgi:hypothetical protein